MLGESLSLIPPSVFGKHFPQYVSFNKYGIIGKCFLLNMVGT